MITYIFVVLFTVISILVYVYIRNNIKYQQIPKQIWCYWGKNIPSILLKNINRWKYLNPKWKITLVTDSNLTKFIDINELPNNFFVSEIECFQFKSDLIRCILLYKYGGVWLDANIITLKPLDWVLKLQKKYIEFVGYYIPNFTTNDNYPVIESWFMASIPKSQFMNILKKELIDAFGNRKKYVSKINKLGVDLQNIPKGLHTYLCIHIAIQYILQIKKYKLKHSLVKSSKDAFKLHGMVNWNSKELVKDLTSTDRTTIARYETLLTDMNLIKLRGDERNVLNKIDKIDENSIIGKILTLDDKLYK